MHTFSIIIPHKNIPTLLQRLLDTIPDIDDIQVVVVDDNSDGEKVDFENFPGKERKNTKIVLDKQGGGAGHARNVGLTFADGKWLVFADSDDLFAPDFYDTLKLYADSHEQIVLFKAETVFSDTLKAAPNRYEKLNRYVDEALVGNRKPQEASLIDPGPCSRIFLRDFVENNNIKFDETLSANDIMFVVKATCWASDVKVVDKVLYVITTRPESLIGRTMTDPKNYLCRLEVKIRRNKFLKDFPSYPKSPVIALVFRALKLGFPTFCKAFVLAVRKGALFSGFGMVFKKVAQRLR